MSFQLKPSVCTIDGRITLPTSTKPAAIEEEDEEWDPNVDSDVEYEDSDEYEVIYVSDYEDESEEESS